MRKTMYWVRDGKPNIELFFSLLDKVRGEITEIEFEKMCSFSKGSLKKMRSGKRPISETTVSTIAYVIYSRDLGSLDTFERHGIVMTLVKYAGYRISTDGGKNESIS